MQDVISVKPTIAGLWFDAASVLGHLIILFYLTVLVIYDGVLIIIRERVLKIMDLNPSILGHTHENELDTAYLEVYLPHNETEKYALYGQSAECQNCPLQSILDHVKNASSVKLDTRYGGHYNLSLIRHSESR